MTLLTKLDEDKLRNDNSIKPIPLLNRYKNPKENISKQYDLAILLLVKYTRETSVHAKRTYMQECSQQHYS